MEKETLKNIEGYVKQKIKSFDSGHDWWHIDRVRNLAMYINRKEKIADPFILEITALLHENSIESGYLLSLPAAECYFI